MADVFVHLGKAKNSKFWFRLGGIKLRRNKRKCFASRKFINLPHHELSECPSNTFKSAVLL